MMSVDPVISADLVALARDGRADLPALDQMLRARPAALPTLVEVVDVLAHRVARITAGATALVATTVVLVALYGPGAALSFDLDSVTVVAGLGLLVLASFAIGGALARRSTAGWRARAVALDRLAVALPIAGLGGLVTVVGVIAASLGPRCWGWMFENGAAIASRLHQLTFAVICVVLAGAAVGWAAMRRPAWLGVLRHPAARVIGVAIAIVTVIVWHRLGAEVRSASAGPVRGVLIAMFAFASFVGIAASTLRRREREDKVLVDAVEDPARALAANLAVRRASRIVRGGVAWLAMLALAIWLHPSRHAAGWRFEPMTLARAALHWPRWGVPSRTVLAIDLGLVVTAAHLVASWLVARLGERVRISDSWAVGATIAGTGAIACALGVTSPIVGESFVLFFTGAGERGAAVLTATLHAMTIGIVVSAFVGVWVGRAVHRGQRGATSCVLRSFARPDVLIAGICLAAASGFASHHLDLDLHRISVSSSLVAPARTAAALGAVWTAGILAVIAHRAVRGCARQR